ncbi:MAG: hypothetical protein KA454_06905 [Polaromonas sp.]|nr:hypothetical protein [Polaromonas sp.]
MTEKNRKAKAGGPRTEVFAMRLDPKLKYLAELAARKQRRSLANFVEWALDEALTKVKLVEYSDTNQYEERTIRDEASKLWDLEPSDRFIKLAESYPELLTYEEQIIWKAIFEISAYETSTDDSGKKIFIEYRFAYGDGSNKKAERFAIKDCWAELVAYSEGTASIQDVQAALKLTIPF